MVTEAVLSKLMLWLLGVHSSEHLGVVVSFPEIQDVDE